MVHMEQVNRFLLGKYFLSFCFAAIFALPITYLVSFAELGVRVEDVLACTSATPSVLPLPHCEEQIYAIQSIGHPLISKKFWLVCGGLFLLFLPLAGVYRAFCRQPVPATLLLIFVFPLLYIWGIVELFRKDS